MGLLKRNCGLVTFYSKVFRVWQNHCGAAKWQVNCSTQHYLLTTGVLFWQCQIVTLYIGNS